MDTIVITRTFEGDLEAKVAYVRSLESRRNWPGAVLEFEKPGMLCYGVGMRLKAATMTDITIEETLSDVEYLDNGDLLFSTVNKALWPDGHMSVIAEYRFSPGDSGDPHTLKYTYTFAPPSSKLVKPKQLPAFHVAMEKVCNRFVRGVLAGGPGAAVPASAPLSVPAAEAAEAPTPAQQAPAQQAPAQQAPKQPAPAQQAPAQPAPAQPAPAEPAAARQAAPTPVASTGYQVAGMDTVVVTHGFDGDLESMVAFTRTLDSRANWPGAVLEYEKADDTLYYGVGMRLNAATMTDVTIEEKLNDVDRLEGGEIRYTTAQRVLWPEGHADAIVEYLFRPGRDGGSNYLRFTYSYTPPSTKLVKTKELPAFRLAMEKVSTRYLDKLTRSRPR